MDCTSLRHKLVFQSNTEAQDDFGQAVKTWATLGTRRCKIEPLSGKELEQAKQVNAEVTHRLTIRYLANLTPKNRALFGSRVFDVLEVRTLDEIKYEQQLLVVERV